jgi:hypothetical protein
MRLNKVSPFLGVNFTNIVRAAFAPIFLRPRVNFTNILRAPLTYESFARSFFALAVKVKLFICARILAQLRQ